MPSRQIFYLVPTPVPDLFIWVEMLLKVVLSVLPRVVAPAMMATEIRAAIRPYSIAVAPDSSFRKREKSLDIDLLHSLC